MTTFFIDPTARLGQNYVLSFVVHEACPPPKEKKLTPASLKLRAHQRVKRAEVMPFSPDPF